MVRESALVMRGRVVFSAVTQVEGAYCCETGKGLRTRAL